MVVRLGFAVATTLAPDVLITDEVLAVGDESFQKKCIAWMENYLAGGGTLLLCSHSMYHVQKLCRHALWLKDGRVERYGPAAEVTQAYLAYHEEKARRATQPSGIADAARRRPPASTRSSASSSAPAQGGAAGLAARRVAARSTRPTVGRRWCSSASCAPTARRCTASPPTWTASLPRALAPDRYAFALTFPRAAAAARHVFGARRTRSIPKACACSTRSRSRSSSPAATRELGLVRIEHRWRVAEPGTRAGHDHHGSPRPTLAPNPPCRSSSSKSIPPPCSRQTCSAPRSRSRYRTFRGTSWPCIATRRAC